MTENFLKLFKISMMASCLVLVVGFLTIPDKKAENGETTNKSQEETYGVLEVSVSLEHEDITYRLVDSSWNKSKEIKNDYIEQSYLEIEWINNTDDVLMYPMSYAISKDGTYFQIKTDHGFYDAFECIMPGESKKEKYYPSQFEILYAESGVYCIEQDYFFALTDENYEQTPYYHAYIEFEIGKNDNYHE